MSLDHRHCCSLFFLKKPERSINSIHLMSVLLGQWQTPPEMHISKPGQINLLCRKLLVASERKWICACASLVNQLLNLTEGTA